MEKNILIVDDDINQAKSLSMILKHKGYGVTTAQDGIEALERVKESSFDIEELLKFTEEILEKKKKTEDGSKK